jgi:uncharacterized protein (DUF2147 family)
MHTIQQVPLALFVALVILHGLASGARATAARGDAILGYWQRGEGEAIVEIRRRSDHYHGVVVASERRPEIVGTEIFKSLRYDTDRRRWRGRVYSIARDRDFDIEMSLPDPDQFVIRLRVLFIRKSVRFNRRSLPSSN